MAARRSKKNKRQLSFKMGLDDERVPKLFGVLLIFFGLYLFIAFTSYLFTWKHDQHYLSGTNWDFLMSSGKQVDNWLGRLGVLVSDFFFRWLPLVKLVPYQSLFQWVVKKVINIDANYDCQCLMVHVYMCTHVHLYTCTLVHLYTCTPVDLYTCTPVHLYTCTLVQREGPHLGVQHQVEQHAGGQQPREHEVEDPEEHGKRLEG